MGPVLYGLITNRLIGIWRYAEKHILLVQRCLGSTAFWRFLLRPTICSQGPPLGLQSPGKERGISVIKYSSHKESRTNYRTNNKGVIKWLSKIHIQSNYSDQTQHGLTAWWINQDRGKNQAYKVWLVLVVLTLLFENWPEIFNQANHQT